MGEFRFDRQGIGISKTDIGVIKNGKAVPVTS